MMSERLLVVDDEVDFTTFVRRVAEAQGFDVRVAFSAREFKSLYSSFKPDVVTMDIVMPELDGIELMKWLVGERCAARIVIMSGFSPQYARAAELIGLVGGPLQVTCLSKPVDLEVLEAALVGQSATGAEPR